MKKILLGLFVTLLIVSPGVKGIGLEYYGIEDSINEDMSVSSIITLKFDKPVSTLEYQLGFRIYNLEAEADYNADCELADSIDSSTILCHFEGMTSEKNLLKLRFDTKGGVQKVGDKYQFSVNYGISLPIERAYISIKLPERGILSEETINQSCFPADCGTATDGKHIIIYWERSELAPGDSLEFSILYAMPFKDSLSNFIILGTTIAVIAAMVGIAVYVRKGKVKPEVVTSVLNGDERKIVSILTEHGGKALQKVLVREGDFSKAKASRLVKNLKGRGVIDIEPVSGRENRIILKEPFLEKGKSGEKEAPG